jgi:hypothetical protein
MILDALGTPLRRGFYALAAPTEKMGWMGTSTEGRFLLRLGRFAVDRHTHFSLLESIADNAIG